jgi:hypothetical protein
MYVNRLAVIVYRSKTGHPNYDYYMPIDKIKKYTYVSSLIVEMPIEYVNSFRINFRQQKLRTLLLFVNQKLLFLFC